MATVNYDPKSKTVTVTFDYDASKGYPASSTGKTLVASTSSGFVSVPGTTLKLSWNATVPNPDYRPSK